MGQSRLLPRVLAGIETGVLGGLAMLVWLAFSSSLELRSAWVAPNLFGAVLAGGPPLEPGFSWLTVSGLGLHLAVTGAAGLLFGLALADSPNRLRVVLLGIIAGLLLYYGSQYWLWRKLGRYVLAYLPPRPAFLAWLIYGLALGFVPAARRRLGARNHETVAAPGAVE